MPLSKSPAFLSRFGLMLFCALASGYAYAHPDERAKCKQDGRTIFVSTKANLSEFDPSQYGAKLVLIRELPEKGMVVSIYEPGRIICAIRTEWPNEKGKK